MGTPVKTDAAIVRRAPGGNQARLRSAAVPAPTRWRIGRASDAAEGDADRLAARALGSAAGPGHAGPDPYGGGAAPASLDPVLAEPGHPLEAGVRARLETGLGVDLSGLRVHDGPAAARASADMGAQAWNAGPHIGFARGAYRPGTAAGDRLLAHEAAHSVQGGDTLRRAPPPGGNFTPEQVELLAAARANLKPKGNAIVGVLIPPEGKPIELMSGGGQGFGSHIEGKATAKMRELGIRKATLLVELEPCEICDRSTYPAESGPSVPRVSKAGNPMPYQTSKINSALPIDSELTVVGPESTGIYRGTMTGTVPVPPKLSTPSKGSAPAPKESPAATPKTSPTPAEPPAPAAPPKTSVPANEGPVPAPAPKPAVPTAEPPMPAPVAKAPTTPTVVPETVPMVEPIPAAPVTVRPQINWRGGLTAGGKALAYIAVFAVLGYFVHKKMEADLKDSIDEAFNGAQPWARRVKSKNPALPVYMKIKVVSSDYSRYVPFLGWLPEPKLYLSSIELVREPMPEPTIVEQDDRLDFFYPGIQHTITYTELMIP